MKKNASLCKKLLITLFPPAICAAILLMRDYFYKLAGLLPPCLFRETTGLLCPGCGMTHAVKAVLEADFIASLKYNPAAPLAATALSALYFQLVISLWIKPVRLLTKQPLAYAFTAALLAAYYIARNAGLFLGFTYI